MVRKCRGIAETAVVDVAGLGGVRTRARAALATVAASSKAAPRRRRVNNASSHLKFSSSSSSPLNVELKSQRRDVIAQEDPVSPAAGASAVLRTETENRFPGRTTSGEASASCCSSNRSSELEKEAVEFVDLEDEGGEIETSTYYCGRERREAMPSSQVRTESEELQSTREMEEADSGQGSTAEKKPTESELEEFFAGPEKEIQKRFAGKYNYDIVKDEPLEQGRYEWVRLKP